jgi:Protein of unknown function (DUF3185)
MNRGFTPSSSGGYVATPPNTRTALLKGTHVQRIIGIALIVTGVILTVWGLNATDSFASHVSKFFTGSPTDRAVWLTLGGIAAIVIGVGAVFYPSRALEA